MILLILIEILSILNTRTIMKLLLAALSLLLSIALVCSPLYLVYIGFVGPNVSFWVRVVLVVIGLVLCRVVKPISIITGKDWKIF